MAFATAGLTLAGACRGAPAGSTSPPAPDPGISRSLTPATTRYDRAEVDFERDPPTRTVASVLTARPCWQNPVNIAFSPPALMASPPFGLGMGTPSVHALANAPPSSVLVDDGVSLYATNTGGTSMRQF
jgi:hypothetical protein